MWFIVIFLFFLFVLRSNCLVFLVSLDGWLLWVCWLLLVGCNIVWVVIVSLFCLFGFWLRLVILFCVLIIVVWVIVVVSYEILSKLMKILLLLLMYFFSIVFNFSVLCFGVCVMWCWLVCFIGLLFVICVLLVFVCLIFGCVLKWCLFRFKLGIIMVNGCYSVNFGLSCLVVGLVLDWFWVVFCKCWKRWGSMIVWLL